jgi:hypothetical protein
MFFRITTAALATIFAAACASGAAPAPSVATQTATASTSAATTAPTVAAGAAATANPDSALIDLIRGGKAVSYRVTYTMVTAGGGQNTSTTFSQAFKSPYYRVEMAMEGSGTVITLVRPEGSYLCGAIFGPSPTCFSTGAGGGANLPAPPQPIPTDLAGWGIVATSGRTVAGQSTSCFSFKAPTTPGGAGFETIGCYTTQGIPLFMSTKSAGTEVSMTATQFSTTVSDADFAVPFPVQKIPGQP